MRYLLKFVAVASCLAVPALPLTAQQKKGGESPPPKFETNKQENKNFEINKENKSITIPLTRDGDYRFGIQDLSKEPTREIPEGEVGGAIILQKRF